MPKPKSALEELLAAASKGQPWEHVIAAGCHQCDAQRDLAALAPGMAQELIDRRSAGQALAEALVEMRDAPGPALEAAHDQARKALADWRELGEAEEAHDG